MARTDKAQDEATKNKGEQRERLMPLRSVPVLSRELKANEPKPKKPAPKLSAGHIGAIVVVVILMLVIVAVPLRNYFSGRSEITRLNEQIAAKELKKQELEQEITRYQDEQYIKEQARLRLGLIDPGETAFRIIDPGIGKSDTVTTTRNEVEAEKGWADIVWESLSTPPEKAAPAEETGEGSENLPIAPQAPSADAPGAEAPGADAPGADAAPHP